MIILDQHSYSKKKLNKIPENMESVDIKMDKVSVMRELTKFEKCSATNSIDNKNLKAIKKYLNQMLVVVTENDNVNIKWKIENNIFKSEPIKLLSYSIYDLDTTNFVKVHENEYIVILDTLDLLKIIAFEFMYKDLLIDNPSDQVEYALRDLGLISVNSSDKLLDFIDSVENNINFVYNSMIAGDTPYKTMQTTIDDYFHSKTFRTKYYREPISFSCKLAGSIIVDKFMHNASTSGMSFKLLMISTDKIAFITNTDNIKEIKEKILEDIAIRSFGRLFNVDINTKIY